MIKLEIILNQLVPQVNYEMFLKYINILHKLESKQTLEGIRACTINKQLYNNVYVGIYTQWYIQQPRYIHSASLSIACI